MIYFFNKYNSTGNDFIIVDNRERSFKFNHSYIKKICDRKFGIGADGFILLENSLVADYFVNYYNSDGFPSSFCGNGSLCSTHFAYTKGIINGAGLFETREGVFECKIDKTNASISLIDVDKFDVDSDKIILNTGSPHYVVFCDRLNMLNVNKIGKEIRFRNEFSPKGINVTFVEKNKDYLFIRTFERGVDAETLSCGTGAVAAVLSAWIRKYIDIQSLRVKTNGGILNVSFDVQNDKFTNIYLSSHIEQVFEGKITKS